MKKRKFSLSAFMVAGVAFVAMAGDAFSQAGTGAGSGVPGLGGSGSGSAIDADKGTGTGTRRDPHSGTVVPDAGQSRGSQAIAEVPPGLGEKGTGQTQSTMERSGGEGSGGDQGSSHGMAQIPSGIGERGTGQTESTMERSGGGKSRR